MGCWYSGNVYSVLQPLSGVLLSSSTGTVTFRHGQRNVQTSVSIQGTGFLQLDSTFSLSLLDVQFVGDGGLGFFCMLGFVC